MDDQTKPQNPKLELTQSLATAKNVLVTVSNNPSVDQLAGAIGLTLLLGKMGKHATAVFSGQVPSTLEFLHPEKTLEKTTDSLRDFIVALDTDKAKELRWKVEGNLVKIFITPYHAAINEKDLEFSQGDFNVDLVMALGVHKKDDLDQAIMAHGRILHDAAVTTINTNAAGELGSINWTDAKASSLCEMIVSLIDSLKIDSKPAQTREGQPNDSQAPDAVQAPLLDAQVATALLTGIVAETQRFSNDRTTSVTMSLSGQLMAAGANQQLVANKLIEPATQSTEPEKTNSIVKPSKPAVKTNEIADLTDLPKPKDTNSLEIEHEEPDVLDEKPADKKPMPPVDDLPRDNQPPVQQIHIDDQGVLHDPRDESKPKFVSQPPALGGTLTASSDSENDDPSIDPLSGKNPVGATLLSHGQPGGDSTPTAEDSKTDLPPKLEEDEKEARDAVINAFQETKPLNAPAELAAVEPMSPAPTPVLSPAPPVAAPMAMPEPAPIPQPTVPKPTPEPVAVGVPMPAAPQVIDANTPPAVPPPIFPFPGGPTK